MDTDGQRLGDHTGDQLRENRVFLGWSQLPMAWHRCEEDPAGAERALEPRTKAEGVLGKQ